MMTIARALINSPTSRRAFEWRKTLFQFISLRITIPHYHTIICLLPFMPCLAYLLSGSTNVSFNTSSVFFPHLFPYSSLPLDHTSRVRSVPYTLVDRQVLKESRFLPSPGSVLTWLPWSSARRRLGPQRRKHTKNKPSKALRIGPRRSSTRFTGVVVDGRKYLPERPVR